MKRLAFLIFCVLVFLSPISGTYASDDDFNFSVEIELSNKCQSGELIYYFEFIKAPVGSVCRFVHNGSNFTGVIVG